MVNFILGEAGSGKSSEIIEKIREYSESKKKIFVIVPEQFTFEYERKMYLKLGSAVSNSINVLSFTRLAGFIFDTFGNRSGEYADDNVKTAVMYLAMKEIRKNKSMLYYTRQAGNRSFIKDALGITEDLRRAAVSPERFASLLNGADAKIRDKGFDISLIYSAYDRILTEKGYRDGLSDITEAAAIANMNDFFEESVFFIDEFDSFSPDELEMTDVAVSEAAEVFVSLCTPETEKNEYSLFATVNSTYLKIKAIADKYSIKCSETILDKPMRFKNAAVETLSRTVFGKRREKISSEGFVKITEARDFYQEADFVCSYIRYLVNTKGYRFGEISVASRQPEDYDALLGAAMERYGIPYFSDTEKSVMHTSVVLLIRSLLELAGRKKMETDTVFRYAKTMLTPLTIEQISSLENFCFKWNVEGVLWESSFTETELAGSVDKKELEYMEGLRAVLIDPVLELRKKCMDCTAAEMCQLIYSFLEEQEITRRIKKLISVYKDNQDTYMASELNRLWGCIVDIFSTLSDVLGDEKMSSEDFCELFILILKQNRFLSAPQELDAVSVVSAEKARLEGQKVIFVMGANEGILPYAVKQSGMLSDTDRQAFEKLGIDLGKDTKRLLTDERFTVYRLFSSVSERVIVTYPLSDSAGGTRYPSYILTRTKGMFSDVITDTASSHDIIFYSPTPQSAYYNYVQNGEQDSVLCASLREVLKEDPVYSARIEYLEMLKPDADHHVEDSELMSVLLGNRLTVSATSFEEYNLCHFKFFCHYALRIAARGRKEMNLMELGNLVHACLEKIFSGCSSREEFLALTDEKITGMIKETSSWYRTENLGGNFGKNARLDAAFEKFTEDTLSLVAHLKEEFSVSKFEPVKFEFELSEKNGVEPVKLTSREGVEIILRGKIDRVDIYEDNGEKFIRVIDYKTGEKKFSLDNIIFGIDMQMLLYLFSVTGNSGPFGQSIPAGVLYMPSGRIALDRKRNDSRDKQLYLQSFYHMTGVVLKELKVLEAMEENIAGVYIPAKLNKAGKDGIPEFNKVVSSCLSRKQFENLRVHTYRLLEKMADDLYSGDISASPLNYDKNKNVCSYCDYREICGNYPRIRERILPDDLEEIKAQLLNEK